MRAARAYLIAKQCFALARSTTFQGERNAAIARGIAVATAAGIDLNRFDIPGRARSQRHDEEPEDLRTMLARLDASLRTRQAEVGAAEHETVYAARRRNFDAAIAAAKARDIARDNRPRLS